jgi:tRNA (mo5U34)-methyltransferase
VPCNHGAEAYQKKIEIPCSVPGIEAKLPGKNRSLVLNSPARLIGDSEFKHGTNQIVSTRRAGVKSMTSEQIQAEMSRIRWFHRIELGNGIVTPGVDDSSVKLQSLGVPENLAGKTVLDIGAWDGFFSFEAERRSAKRVLATDSFCWGGAGWGTKEGFDFARRILNSRVEDREIDVMHLSPEKVGAFDVVLFLGVLYHMRHPLLALDILGSVTAPGGVAIIETHVDMLHLERSAIAFYPGTELNGDGSNWCGPNPFAVEGMLKEAGFKKVEVHTTSGNQSIAQAATTGKQLHNQNPEEIVANRMVFHAWR